MRRSLFLLLRLRKPEDEVGESPRKAKITKPATQIGSLAGLDSLGVTGQKPKASDKNMNPSGDGSSVPKAPPRSEKGRPK